MSITHLEPQNIWKNFAALNAVPRPSKKEEKVIEFIKNFGKNLNLETTEDEVGNVIIRKPATSGMENRQTIVLQSHLDMVCQKNNNVNFDFETQGIEMYTDGDWVKAKGTTLGADNGLGVAAIMSILESSDIAHPAVARFVLPICTTINMNGCAAFILVTSLFVMQNAGIELTMGTMIAWLFIAVLAAVGNAGVPMGCYFLTLSLMSSIGAPIGLMGVILPIYTIIDMIETAENVWSDASVCAMVDHDLEGTLDDENFDDTSMQAI